MEQRLAESVICDPHPTLRSWVRGYTGSRLQGFDPGIHLALPSASLVTVISMDRGIEMAAPNESGLRSYRSPVAALHQSPMAIRHQGRAFDISIEMAPAGARALLGVPCRELSRGIVELADCWGPAAEELVDRLQAAPDWASRFAILDSILMTLSRKQATSRDPLARAWDRLTSTSERASVGDVAREVGYSRRHLQNRFVTEYGVTPIRVARLARLQRSVAHLRSLERRRRHEPGGRRTTLAEVAVTAGFYDQAHMSRDWNDMVGYSPSTWLAAEELPFVQDASQARVENG